MHEHVLYQLAHDRQCEMRKAAQWDQRLHRSSQERAAEARSLEHERRRQRANLALRQAE